MEAQYYEVRILGDRHPFHISVPQWPADAERDRQYIEDTCTVWGVDPGKIVDIEVVGSEAVRSIFAKEK